MPLYKLLIMTLILFSVMGCAKQHVPYYSIPPSESSAKLTVNNNTGLLLNVQPWSGAENCSGPLQAFPNELKINFVPVMAKVDYSLYGGEPISLLVAATNGPAQCTYYLTFEPIAGRDYLLMFNEDKEKENCLVSLSISTKEGLKEEKSLRKRLGRVPFSNDGEWCS